MKNSEIKLRPYQSEFINNINKKYQSGFTRVVGVAPCGSGKTIIAAKMVRDALNNNYKSLFFVHRYELIDQTSKAFSNMNIEHGIISAGVSSNSNADVQIASIQTLCRRLHSIPTPDFLICDECHHILANSYMQVLDYWNNAKLLGLTATPERAGGVKLGKVFNSMVIGPSVKELIKLGNLAEYRYFAPDTNIDVSNVEVKYGDYDNHSLEKIMSSKKIIGDIVYNYLKYAKGKSAICYCVNVAHSVKVCNEFLSYDISAAQCDGNTPKNVRRSLIEDFRRGKIKILCNAELFGEGFDVPNMDAVILARPTKSLTLYVQQSMRSMRPDPANSKKEAIIIDHVQNYARFGLPDFNRNWSLFDLPRTKKPNDDKFKRCPVCSAILLPYTRKCPECGFVFKSKNDDIIGKTDDKEFDIDDGNLIEIYSSIVGSSSSIEQFMEIAKARNYQRAWAAKKALQFAKSLDDCRHIAKIVGYKQDWAWFQWKELQQLRRQ